MHEPSILDLVATRVLAGDDAEEVGLLALFGRSAEDCIFRDRAAQVATYPLLVWSQADGAGDERGGCRTHARLGLRVLVVGREGVDDALVARVMGRVDSLLENQSVEIEGVEEHGTPAARVFFYRDGPIPSYPGADPRLSQRYHHEGAIYHAVVSH